MTNELSNEEAAELLLQMQDMAPAKRFSEALRMGAEALLVAEKDYDAEILRKIGHLLRYVDQTEYSGTYDVGVKVIMDERDQLRQQLAEAQEYKRDAELFRGLASMAREEGREGGWWGVYTLPHFQAWDSTMFRNKPRMPKQTFAEAVSAAIASQKDQT